MLENWVLELFLCKESLAQFWGQIETRKMCNATLITLKETGSQAPYDFESIHSLLFRGLDYEIGRK